MSVLKIIGTVFILAYCILYLFWYLISIVGVWLHSKSWGWFSLVDRGGRANGGCGILGDGISVTGFRYGWEIMFIMYPWSIVITIGCSSPFHPITNILPTQSPQSISLYPPLPYNSLHLSHIFTYHNLSYVIFTNIDMFLLFAISINDIIDRYVIATVKNDEICSLFIHGFFSDVFFGFGI